MDLTWIYIVCYALLLLFAGYMFPVIKNKNIARALAWSTSVATVAISVLVTAHQLPLLRMLIIVFLQLLSMKIIVAVETYSGENKLNIFQWSAFSLGWFGMRPVLFEKLPSPSLPYIDLVMKGLSRIVIGFFLLYLSTIAERYPEGERFFFPQLLLLVGLSLILHFGILNLSAAAWRSKGVDAPELFRAPYKSRSLKEFWGKRWNIAFSEMTALIAYRPLRTRIGIEKAVIVSFLLSGLLHEIAISFPVRSGYGLPMLYFVIHATVMHLEATSPVVQRIIGHRILSHAWVMVFLILPMPLLFHREFMLNVLIPLRNLLLSIPGLV
jgi:hypothetical protein